MTQQPTDPVTKAMKKAEAKWIKDNEKLLAMSPSIPQKTDNELKMLMFDKTLKPFIQEALTSLAQEKDKAYNKRETQLLNELADADTCWNEIKQLKSLYDNVRTQCDAFRNKCDQLKTDEIRWLRDLAKLGRNHNSPRTMRLIQERLAQLRGSK